MIRLPSRHRLPWASLVLLSLACGSTEPESGKGPYDTDPTAAELALETLRIADGFHAELYAAEPHVVDPVEMCFDENGGVYVAEMLDYPFDPEEGRQPQSRVRYVADTNGDGRVDSSKIFATNLLQVTSVFPWKGGLLVASAPDILYLRDLDGDNIADVKEVWYTGFDTNVSPEARITNFRFNLDNWIYAANNGRPGRITSPKFPDKPEVLVRGYDFRFHPGTGDFAPAAGPTQFGMSFNDWGERFVTQNTVHLRHAVLPARYVLRNPSYAPPSMLHYVPDDDPRDSKVYPLTQPQQWRVERTAARQERYDETQPGRMELVGGHFTAATGTTVYSGDAWGEQYYGNVFVADANGGLVHREELFDDGATYRSEPRPEGGPELWASTDPWHRPVNLANAPDGNLYVLDFYREYIEEPASIPEAIKQRLQLDFYRGVDRGRIWRIVADEPAVERDLGVALGDASLEALVALLGHRNGWHRTTAQRLLLERQDEAATEPLRSLAASGGTPQARLHALWALQGQGALRAAEVRRALADEDPGVRRNAVRLAEAFLPQLAEAIVNCKDDSDAKVRFQVALSLGEIEGAVKPLAAMAAEHAGDEWMRAALLTSVERPWAVFNRLLLAHREFFADGPDAEQHQALAGALASQIGANPGRDQLTLLLQALGASPRLRDAAWKAATLRGLADGLDLSGRRRLRVPGSETLFGRWMGDGDDDVRAAALDAAQYFSLPGMLADARRAAASEDIEIARRVRAVRFLRGGSYGRVAPVLGKILASPAAPELHVAAIETLSSFDDDSAAQALLQGWAGYGPQARQRAVDALIRRAGWASALLDAVEDGAIAASAIDPVAKIRLADHPEAAISERARSLLGSAGGDRAQVVEQFQDVLALEADATRGKAVFEDNCAKCHLARADRGRLGPDLSGINNKTREELLAHILDPSFEIQSNYTNYIVVDKQGRIYDGLLASETAEAVTLRGEYENVSLRRSEIEEMRASTVSLMPEGLEQDMSRQELADVIGYLRAGL